MMNFKKLSLGLTVAGLTFVTLTPKAQAFQFSYLSTSQSSTGGFFDFNFELQADPGDAVSTDQSLVISGFEQVIAASMTAPQTNTAGVIYSDSTFDPDKTTFNNTSVTFKTIGEVAAQRRPVKFQTFTITARDVPSGFVNPDFGGNPLDPTPVPEPLTILGSLAALGFGSRCQKEFAKKQSTNSEEA
jgi:hypothetical protein